MDVPTPEIPGRALTPKQKRAVIERVFAAWEKHPRQRLGQLLCNVQSGPHDSLFFVEDEALAEVLERWKGF